MRHVTLTCPACWASERAVGDPDEKDHGHSGVFHCFNCGHSGTYKVSFEMKEQ